MKKEAVRKTGNIRKRTSAVEIFPYHAMGYTGFDDESLMADDMVAMMNAGVGMVGVAITSTFRNASLNSRVSEARAATAFL